MEQTDFWDHANSKSKAIRFLVRKYLGCLKSITKETDWDYDGPEYILDVGCGPFPSIFVFKEAEYYGIDPLIDEYRALGYPIDLWAHQGFHYYANSVEKIPFDDSFFNVVISVNAIDHADGIFRMHVHYHKKTVCEPIELNDQVFLENYHWVLNLKKIYHSRTKDMGLYTAPEGELFVLWGNS